MPRYVVHRRFAGVSEAEMQEVNIRAGRLPVERFTDLTWEHSHVCIGRDGEFESFCIYRAPSAERLHEHAEVLGYHAVLDILEIIDDVTPADVGAGP
ncbi:MAG: DUF4242 domain-containing protein [Acidimicrobiales bacterium]